MTLVVGDLHFFAARSNVIKYWKELPAILKKDDAEECERVALQIDEAPSWLPFFDAGCIGGYGPSSSRREFTGSSTSSMATRTGSWIGLIKE